MDKNELRPIEQLVTVDYTDDNIRTLSDMEHSRTRPGKYIGKLGAAAPPADRISVLPKE